MTQAPVAGVPASGPGGRRGDSARISSARVPHRRTALVTRERAASTTIGFVSLHGGGRRVGARVSARLRRHGHAAHRPLDAADSGCRRPHSQLRPLPERTWAHGAGIGAGADQRARLALVTTRGAERTFLALARVESFTHRRPPFTIVGGLTVDEGFLARLARDPSIVVSVPTLAASCSTARLNAERHGRFRRRRAGGSCRCRDSGRRRSIDVVRRASGHPIAGAAERPAAQRGFMVARDGRGNSIAALLLARLGVVARQRTAGHACRKDRGTRSRSSRRRVRRGTDEVGRLSRLLGDLAADCAPARPACARRSGAPPSASLARQINHDIKNGLIPLRNVMRHLSQVERERTGRAAWRLRRAPADRRVEPGVSRDARDELSAPVAPDRTAGMRSECAHHRRRARRARPRARRIRHRSRESSANGRAIRSPSVVSSKT